MRMRLGRLTARGILRREGTTEDGGLMLTTFKNETRITLQDVHASLIREERRPLY